MKLIRILSVVRLGVVPLALAKVLLDRSEFPSTYAVAAWWLLAIEVLVAASLLALAFRWRRRVRWLATLNVAADFGLIAAMLLVYAWEPGQTLRTLLFLAVLEAALFFRLRGGLLRAMPVSRMARPSGDRVGHGPGNDVRRRE